MSSIVGKEVTLFKYKITLVQARNLIKVDTFGKSDPYVVLQVGSWKAQSEVVKECLDPQFNDKEFEIIVDSQLPVILKVLDWNERLKHFSLGEAKLEYEEIVSRNGSRVTLPLLTVKSGEIELIVEIEPLLPSLTCMKQIPIDRFVEEVKAHEDERSDQENNLYGVEIRVFGAEKLNAADWNGLSDPYCVVYDGKVVFQETPVAKKTLNPRWDNSVFTFYTKLSDLKKKNFSFKVMDWNELTASEQIASCDLDVVEYLLTRKSEKNTFPLFLGVRLIAEGTLNFEISVSKIAADAAAYSPPGYV